MSSERRRADWQRLLDYLFGVFGEWVSSAELHRELGVMVHSRVADVRKAVGVYGCRVERDRLPPPATRGEAYRYRLVGNRVALVESGLVGGVGGSPRPDRTPSSSSEPFPAGASVVLVNLAALTVDGDYGLVENPDTGIIHALDPERRLDTLCGLAIVDWTSLVSYPPGAPGCGGCLELAEELQAPPPVADPEQLAFLAPTRPRELFS